MFKCIIIKFNVKFYVCKYYAYLHQTNTFVADQSSYPSRGGKT